jgi:hypothetical protein
MNNDEKQLVTLDSRAKQLDKIAATFSSALAVTDDSPFSSALTLSQGITALRELLDDGIMREVMKLADTPLGFLTDRGPTARNRDGSPVSPYQIGEVRDAIIEAALRGFRVAGNEFNIISGRFYGAKSGLHRKVITYPGVTDFRESLGIPKLVGDRGAVVTAEATWLKNGVKDELKREFAIRVNAAMGTDAILGKLQRKLYAAVLNRLSGIFTPEGEVVDEVITTVEQQSSRTPEIKKPEMTKPPAAAPVAPEKAKERIAEMKEAARTPAPGPAPSAQEEAGQTKESTIGPSTAELVRDKLANTLFTVTDFMAVLRRNKLATTESTIDEVDPKNLALVLDDWDTALEQMEAGAV